MKTTCRKALLLALALLFAPLGLSQEQAVDSQSGMEEAISDSKVNVNEADAETIAAILDGIGASRAEAIVSYREEYGEFKSLEELLMVNGVGEVTVRNNSEKILFD